MEIQKNSQDDDKTFLSLEPVFTVSQLLIRSPLFQLAGGKVNKY